MYLFLLEFTYLVIMKDQAHISLIEQYLIDFVRQLRSDNNLTQDDLASILGVGKSFISNVESANHRAKYNLTHLNVFADYFGMNPQAFLPNSAFHVDELKAKKPKAATKKVAKKAATKKLANKKSK